VRRVALEMGADGFVLKRDLAADLLPTVESVLAGRSGTASTAENGILNLAQAKVNPGHRR
ncbi:MAG: hypothetical protein MUC53_00840, partial [Candidatus Contendobacter sp.]|nr:hypothetical protein [Candidatus Contendobacter sp.]